MKALLKTCTFLILLGFSSELVAQKYFSVRTGLNYSTMTVKDNNNDFSDDFNVIPGSHIAILAQVPFRRRFTVETGLVLNMKGFDFQDTFVLNGQNYDVNIKYNLYYVNIPFALKPTFRWRRANMYTLIGPYVGYGFSGTDETKVSMGGLSNTTTNYIVWGTDNNSDLRRFDYGLTLGIGANIKRFGVGLHYDMGFANISATRPNGEVMNNHMATFIVSYNLGRW
jgi:hypothetical protein